jgi:thiosulfate/3-mercaptopyruvate sulfurtransferase
VFARIIAPTFPQRSPPWLLTTEAIADQRIDPEHSPWSSVDMANQVRRLVLHENAPSMCYDVAAEMDTVTMATASYANPRIIIETDELARNLDDPRMRVFDATVQFALNESSEMGWVSGRADYDSAHLPGAAFFDLLGTFSDTGQTLPFMLPDEAAFKASLGAVGIDRDSRVVVYSAGHMMWATRAWWMLHIHGVDVAVLNGGMAKWQAEGRPVSDQDEAYPAAVFEGTRDHARVATRDDVLAAIGGGGAKLVNALSAAQHAGTGGTVFGGRPGHIPGSLSLPYDDLCDPETGCFFAADELRTRMETIGLLEDGRVITYCGAGMSSTLDAFAQALLGHDDVAVYDASLVEWAADPDLPMETG